MIKFPKINKKNVLKRDNFEKVSNLVDDIIEKNNKNVHAKRIKINLKNLKDKHIVMNNIMNEINGSKGNDYIKDRNKIIVKMLVSGLKPTQIVNLKKDDINSLNIEEEYKKELQQFVYKYYKPENQELVILDVTQKNRITPNTINQIKKRYINNKI